MGTRNIIFAAAAALFGQSGGSFGGQPRHHSILTDARQIIEPSVAVAERDWQARDRYAYMECDESRRLDSQGRVKSQDVDVSRIVLVNGAPFEQLVEHNGRPPTADERRKQIEKIEKQKHETAAERSVLLEKEQEGRSFVRRPTSCSISIPSASRGHDGGRLKC
jgi:hypothetical protein